VEVSDAFRRPDDDTPTAPGGVLGGSTPRQRTRQRHEPSDLARCAADLSSAVVAQTYRASTNDLPGEVAVRRIGLLIVFWRRFKTEAAMVWRMLVDSRVPPISKLIAIAALAYLVSPVDFLSDLVPILGWVDDALIVGGLLWLAYRFLPRDLYEAIRRRAGGSAAPDPAAGGAPRPQIIEGQAERVA
jgi:uncharacterized membrane protein YkvA (DUF1232 family)